MPDAETILHASNLEVALASYFEIPTVEEAKALRVIVARLQADQEAILARVGRNLRAR